MTTETKEQAEAVRWFRKTYPEHSAALRPSMNGLKRQSRVNGAKAWNFMKSQGADPDDVDIVILVPKGEYFGLVIEHKGADQGHTLTEGQQAQLDYFAGLGYCAISTRGTEALKAAIRTYFEQ